MEEQKKNEGANARRFRPMTHGCVIRDLRLSRAVEELYADELYAMCAASYRAMMVRECDPTLSELFYEQMHDEIAHFEFLGELILALGGNPALRAPIRVEPVRRAEDARGGCSAVIAALTDAALCEKKRTIDRYQTLLGRTEDRVVRASLMYLIDEEEAHASRLLRYIDPLT